MLETGESLLRRSIKIYCSDKDATVGQIQYIYVLNTGQVIGNCSIFTGKQVSSGEVLCCGMLFFF